MSILAVAADPNTVLLNYGAIGAIAILLIGFAWTAWKRERDRGDRLEKQLQVDHDKLVDTIVEVLVQTRDALIASNDYLRDLAHRRRT